jgi:hypothetical protein
VGLGFEIRLQSAEQVAGEASALLRCFSVEDLDPLPRNALDCESLTSTVIGKHFWQRV